jgi:hypothetical protein
MLTDLDPKEVAAVKTALNARRLYLREELLTEDQDSDRARDLRAELEGLVSGARRLGLIIP